MSCPLFALMTACTRADTDSTSLGSVVDQIYRSVVWSRAWAEADEKRLTINTVDLLTFRQEPRNSVGNLYSLYFQKISIRFKIRVFIPNSQCKIKFFQTPTVYNKKKKKMYKPSHTLLYVKDMSAVFFLSLWFCWVTA